MSKGNRSIDIMRGVIFGFLLGVVFCVIAFLLPIAPNEIFGSDTNPPDQTGYNAHQCGDGNKPVWGPWFGFCFGLYDSTAQWIMMAFTIVAAGLLYGALRQANKTNAAAVKASEAALEANQIMIEVNRPWIVWDFQPVGDTFNQSDVRIGFRAAIKNIGSRPAICELISCGRWTSDEYISERLAKFNGDGAGALIPDKTRSTTHMVVLPGQSFVVGDISVESGTMSGEGCVAYVDPHTRIWHHSLRRVLYTINLKRGREDSSPKTMEDYDIAISGSDYGHTEVS